VRIKAYNFGPFILQHLYCGMVQRTHIYFPGGFQLFVNAERHLIGVRCAEPDNSYRIHLTASILLSCIALIILTSSLIFLERIVKRISPSLTEFFIILLLSCVSWNNFSPLLSSFASF